MKFVSVLQLAVTLMLMSLNTACRDNSGVTLHEAHVYKGKQDTHETDALARQQRLQQRALQAFSDR